MNIQKKLIQYIIYILKEYNALLSNLFTSNIEISIELQYLIIEASAAGIESWDLSILRYNNMKSFIHVDRDYHSKYIRSCWIDVPMKNDLVGRQSDNNITRKDTHINLGADSVKVTIVI